MCTTQTNKEARCKCSQHNQINHFICSTFLYLVVLWVFAAHVLPNWWSCFLNLQVFFYLQRVELSRPHKKKKKMLTVTTLCIPVVLLICCYFGVLLTILPWWIFVRTFCQNINTHARTHARTHTHTHTYTHTHTPICLCNRPVFC